MTADDHRIWRERLGAYVLGQLSGEERTATEAHLEGCAECRAEADSLSPMAAMLERADPDQLSPAPAPPADLGDRIARRIAAERGKTRRRRRLQFGFGLGAAVAATTAAVLLAVSLTGSTPTQPNPETVAFKGLPKGVSVDASLQSRAWGSNVSLHVRGFRPGTLCTVWLRRNDGTKVPAGSFRYVYAGESDEAQLSSGLDPPDVKAIGLKAGSRTFVAPVGSQNLGPATS
jgi:putative zinc finger protein